MRKILFKSLILFVIVITCCNNKDELKEDKQQVITNKEQEAGTKKTIAPHIRALNDSAIALMKRSHLFSEKQKQDSMIFAAIDLLDSAISLDSSYQLPYSNKFTALRGLGDFENAIKTMHLLLEINRDPQLILLLGMTYNESGKQEYAQKYFAESFQIYQERIQKPSASMTDTMNLYSALIYLKGKEQMYKVLEKELKHSPENQTLLLIKEMFEDFEREN